MTRLHSTVRVAVAGVFHETNTFAPGLTDLPMFEKEWVNGSDEFLARYAGTRTSMGGVIDKAHELGVELIPGVYTYTTPSGMVTAQTAEEIICKIVSSISSDTDGVILILHGAMVSEQYFDVEGELLRRVREKIGYRVPLAATLDLHANISKLMVAQADILVGYNTYPHIDMYERAEEALDLLVRTIQQEIHPAMVFNRPGMLVSAQTMDTTVPGPMQDLIDKASSMRSDERVLSITVAGGFPYSDVPDAGLSIVVVVNEDADLATEVASELGKMAWSRREDFRITLVEPERAISAALLTEHRPVIFVEGSDNVGGGSPADATHTLKYLMNAKAKSLVVIRDVEAANRAHALGTGSRIQCSVGGKSDGFHGSPVPINGRIRLLFDGVYRHVGLYQTGLLASMGKTAVVETENVTLVITEERVPPWDIGHIVSVGLNPRDFDIILVKAAVAWKTAFGSIAASKMDIDTPGCCSANLSHFDYRKLNTPLYPFDINATYQGI